MESNLTSRIRSRDLCIAFLLASSWCATALAAEHRLQGIDGQHQQGNQLCWAATSAMAVNSFNLPTGRVSQGKLAAHAFLGVWTVAQEQALPVHKKQDLQEKIDECEDKIADCNYNKESVLLGLRHRQTAEGEAQSWREIVRQLDDNRPFLFSWDIPAKRDRPRRFRHWAEGKHQLIALGYRVKRGTRQILVWDPWPVEETLREVPHAQIDKWIDYKEYANADSIDMGLEATHYFDIYDLRPDVESVSQQITQPLPRRIPPSFTRLSPVSFEELATSSATAIEKLKRDRRDVEPGPPLPIIALHHEEVIDDAGAAHLLVPRTAVLLVPLYRGGEVVDATLLVHEEAGWVRRGYANNEVTRRAMAALGTQSSAVGAAPARFYLLSIPQHGTFFLAREFGQQARLTALASDWPFRLTHGETLSAESAFAQMRRGLANP